MDRVGADPRPGRAIVERRQYAFSELGRVVGWKQVSGLAIADQLAMPADIGGSDDALLCHRLERLQRCNEFGQAPRHTGKYQYIREVVIARDFTMRYPASKDDIARKAELVGEFVQGAFFRSSSDEQ